MNIDPDFAIFAMLLFGLFWGWLVAYITYRRRTVKERARSRRSVENAYRHGLDDGRKDGYETALEDPTSVKVAYRKLFLENHNS